MGDFPLSNKGNGSWTAHTAGARRAEVKRLTELMTNAMAEEVQQMAELFASKADEELFGQTEFQLRDLVLAAGCRVLEAVLEDRKKGGTEAAAPPARTAGRMPGSSAGGSER